ncbi:MAG: ATP-binding protein [Thermodesulfobacteriota bacterium]
MRLILTSLRARMALSFGVLFAIILISVSLIRTFGLPLTSDRGSFGDAQDLLFTQLNLLADLNKERVLFWLEERKKDAIELAESAVVASSVKRLLEPARQAANLQRPSHEIRAHLYAHVGTLIDTLDAVMKSHDIYERIQIIDTVEGLVLASTEDAEIGTYVPLHRVAPGVPAESHKATVILADSSVVGRPSLLIVHPIPDKSAAPDRGEPPVLGMVLVYVDVDRFPKPLSYRAGATGASEEVVLVDQDLRIITPLKFALPDGSQAKPLEYRNKGEPAVLAAQGQEGVATKRDYRGVTVVAAYRHIEVNPNTGWGLAVTIDQDDILSPLRRRLAYASLVSLLGVLAAAVMAAVIAGRIARPVRALSLAAKEVESGNLNARAQIVSSDDVGNLAVTFNSMIEKVRNWHDDLEAQVRQRTQRLTELNEELTREVAERTRAEEKLRQQSDFLETVLDSLAHPFCVIDAGDYGIRIANSAAMRGDMREGATCYSVTHGRTEPCSGKDHPCPLRAVRQSGKPAVVEHVHYDKEANPRSVEIHAYPIFNTDGVVAQVIEYFLDITDRRHEEKERDRLIGELEAKNAELERFTYTVSHDLKSPLITIKGFLGYLEKDMVSGNVERLRADSARIHHAVEKMARLLDELLELSRIGRIINPPEDVPLGRVVREVLDSLAGRIMERGVTIEIPEDLPVLYGDAVRLREVVENLLDNAVKFMGDQPGPRVEIGVRSGSGETVIFVKDNGSGVDPKYHEKIFGLFERLGHHTEGTGIGLAIVRRIVEVHGGRIWVESEGLGQGSTFCLTLPTRKDGNRG